MGAVSVLIADDFDVIRNKIQRVLESSGKYKVIASVPSGAEAVKAYDQYSPDIVLMDIEMERQNSGIEAAEAILEEHEDARIVYLTSHDSDDIIVKAMATGAMDYIVKDGLDVDLISHLDAVIVGKVQLEAKVHSVVMQEYKRLRKNEEGMMYFVKNLSSLTPVEKELISLLLQGMKIREISNYRCVEIVTVKSQIRTLLQKVGCSRTKELCRIIERLNLSQLFIK